MRIFVQYAMQHATNLSEVLLCHKKKKILIYEDRLFPPNMGREGGGVLKLVRGLMGVVYGVVYK